MHSLFCSGRDFSFMFYTVQITALTWIGSCTHCNLVVDLHGLNILHHNVVQPLSYTQTQTLLLEILIFSLTFSQAGFTSSISSQFSKLRHF